MHVKNLIKMLDFQILYLETIAPDVVMLEATYTNDNCQECFYKETVSLSYLKSQYKKHFGIALKNISECS